MEENRAIEAFGALAQDTRLKVYRLLADSGETGLPAGDISAVLGIPQNTLSFHLNQLERADLVRSRRAGRYIIYRAEPDTMKHLLKFMVENCCGPAAGGRKT